MRPGDREHALRAQSGFTYVAMLFALAIFGIGLAAIGESWSVASHRDKEAELIVVGNAYVRAIGSYYRLSPGTPKTYPSSLNDLVEDKRFVGTVRHLRRVYRDPISNDVNWGLVKAPSGGIVGIYSLSDKATLHTQAQVQVDGTSIVGARYSDWKFIYKEKP